MALQHSNMMHMGKQNSDSERHRVGSLLSMDSDWDISEDVAQAKLRGCAVLGCFLLCVALFTGGLAFPLVEVVIFPGSPDMETRLVKSVISMISLAFENGSGFVGMIMLFCTVGIPMVLFAGMFIIMYENFFAIGFGWNAMFRPGARALLVSFMYISTSYQVVMIFLVLLFTCFFSGLGSQTILRAGFHFLAVYCLASVGLIQAMDFLRVDTDKDCEESDELTRMDAMTGLNLRRKLSSFFPSLPGIKETANVDAFQVFFFQSFFLVLLIFGFNQPLLDVRVTYQGVALQRMALSLRDILGNLATAAPFHVVLVFSLLVLVIPVLYGFLLVAVGVLDTCVRVCFEEEQQDAISDTLLWLAKLLRPWVMIDVFTIALIIVLYAVQNEYVSATIPNGIIHFGQNGAPSLSFGPTATEAAENFQANTGEEHWLHIFSGMYLIVGAGIATIFLRWFWSSAAGGHRKKDELPQDRSELQGLELYQHIPAVSQNASRADGQILSGTTPITGFIEMVESDSFQEESVVTRYVAGKSCRCLVLWTVICVLLHSLPPPQRHYQLSSMNAALQNSMPFLNKLLVQYAPQTVGNCKYPAFGIPQPCFDNGILDMEVHGTHRITAEWMSGLKSLKLTNISITRTQTLAASPPVGLLLNSVQAAPAILNRFVVSVSGVIAEPQMFLKIEHCPKNHTSLQAIVGQGLCRPFLDTADACCEPNRKFGIQIAAECNAGEQGLENLRVEGMQMDTMTVKPEMWKGHIQVLIADKNITKPVLANVKENLMYYLTEEALMRINGQEINLVGFLNRVLRFNAPHQEFHCR